MLARLRKATEEKEEGFTLIELLVVIIIIGILAAIAIPTFLNQRKKGWDAQAKADARNLATLEETYYTDANSYKTGADLAAVKLALTDYKPSSQVVDAKITLSTADPQNYCISVKSNSGTWFTYASGLGGLQSATATTAPACA